MNAFIINLSNIFDFDISMPVLSGLVANKQVWISKDSGAFPVNPTEALVVNKLFEFSNKYEHMRITLDTATDNSAELYLILGYEEWEFLPYGKLNSYSLFKIQYILDKLSELFKKPVKSLPFKLRIFLTAQAFSTKHGFWGMIEEKGYIENDSLQWFSSDLVEKGLPLKIGDDNSFLAGKKADALVDQSVRSELDKYFAQFCAKFDGFVLEQQIPNTTADEWKQDFKTKLDSISTIKELTEVLAAPTSALKMFLFHTFSLVAYSSNLPPIYKYSIDTSSTANGLRDKFEYTQFIIQFIIAPFIEEKQKIYKVEGIIVNTQALVPTLGKMKGTIERYKKKVIDLEKQEDYNVYSVNESYYRNLPTIEKYERSQFYNLGSVRNTLGWFYNRDKKESIIQEFHRRSYSDLENKIPIETGSFSSLLKEALNKQSKSIVVRMIPSEIIRFEQSRVASPIDFQHYAVERDRLLKEQEVQIEELTKMLPRLPFGSNVMISVVFVLLIMALFLLPIFSGEYWEGMAITLPIFAIGVGAFAFQSLYKIRKQIDNKIRDIEEIRLSLANNLMAHCNNIKTAATQMAEAFAKRETLKSIKKVQDKYDIKSYRYLAYENFHVVNSDSITRLSKIYGMDIESTDVSSIGMSYEMHPEDDPNLIYEFPINDIDIVMNNQQTPMSNVRTILKKVKIRTI